jgi:phosphohistidine swiveling domain-containing protein
MSLYHFNQITKEHSFLGGKGYTLGLMKNAGFPVPDGLILTDMPKDEAEWEEICSWWKNSGSTFLAIRSSALGEDSNTQSFAGQNSTYLNINTESGIRNAILNCFQSLHKKSSSLYREHFLKEKTSDAKMNVVLQIMVKPKFAGVFFSVDPRSNENKWIVEAIDGLGEDLVSGKRTPWHYEEKKVETSTLFDVANLVKTGMVIRDFFGVEIDIEWAIDQQDNLKILQARPITALSGKSEEKRMIAEELARLNRTYPAETVWDGATFAEWSGPPTELTFSIWKKAFSKNRAFSNALKKLGYLGIEQELTNETHSMLEKIFDRPFINISMLAPLYFGPIPYRLEDKKGPKLKFDFKKMTFKMFFLTPWTIGRMIRVSIQLSTQRQKWLIECTKELSEFSKKSFRVSDTNYYEKLSEEKLFEVFKEETQDFYQYHLLWPLVLASLIQSTTESLKSFLKGVFKEEEIEQKINHWLSIGLHSVTMDMNIEYAQACKNLDKRTHFLQKYGHRGPGELELANPRWLEIGEGAFFKLKTNETKLPNENMVSVVLEIQKLKTYKAQVIEKEWLLLSEMLELREKWKMSLLSPYSHIRFIALEIAKRYNLGPDIFWLSDDEILNKDFDKMKANKRITHAEMSKSIYLPTIVSLSALENLLASNEGSKNSKVFKGEALSPGLVYGEVRVVSDPDNINTEAWPDNTVLVAQSTDPGWTGLFLKSKAIVVEKGGVLSHCAIVAREMNLPAVSSIKQCHLRLKDGDKIWVDGNNGRISLA